QSRPRTILVPRRRERRDLLGRGGPVPSRPRRDRVVRKLRARGRAGTRRARGVLQRRRAPRVVVASSTPVRAIGLLQSLPTQPGDGRRTEFAPPPLDGCSLLNSQIAPKLSRLFDAALPPNRGKTQRLRAARREQQSFLRRSRAPLN